MTKKIVNRKRINIKVVENYIKNLEIDKNKEEVNEFMKLSEYSLKDFLENEPDLYTDEDLKKRY